MKSYSYLTHQASTNPSQATQHLDASAWFAKALGLLLLTLAALALLALMGCKDAGKAGGGDKPPPLSAPPEAPAGGGMAVPPPNAATSAPGGSGTKP